MAVLRSSLLGFVRRSGRKPTKASHAYAARPRAAIKPLMRSCIALH